MYNTFKRYDISFIFLNNNKDDIGNSL